MIDLAPGYSVEIDRVDKDAWHETTKCFDDNNIYQTWSYDAVRFGRKNISHLVLKRFESIAAVAQIRIEKLPILNAGIGYVRWGPLWKLRRHPVDAEIFQQVIRALRNEYAGKRGLVLRLHPIIFDDDDPSLLAHLKQEGYIFNSNLGRYRTLVLDLSVSLEDLRKGLKQKWRNCLNHAQKNDLVIIEGYDDKLFEMFLWLYNEMLGRKKYLDSLDINNFKRIQEDLPDELKMKIFLSTNKDKVGAGAFCSAIGNTGVYFLGATNDVGMKDQGSYLIQWKMMEWLKSIGCEWYNLHGINPVTNPGTFKFKDGICGKNGKDVYFIGNFDTHMNLVSHFSVKYGEMMRTTYQRVLRNVVFKI